MLRVSLMLALTACTHIETVGPDAQGYHWVKDGPTGDPRIHRNVDVFLACGLEKCAKSCAVIANGICDVYLPPNPEPWQEWHETRHCQGWRHPDWTGGATLGRGRP